MPRVLITAEAVFGFKLYLRNQLGHLDSHIVFGPVDDIQLLRNMYMAELVEPYEEEGPDLANSGQFKMYKKYFRKGSAFEWCQPIENEAQWSQADAYGTGVVECLLDIFNIEKKEVASV